MLTPPTKLLPSCANAVGYLFILNMVVFPPITLPRAASGVMVRLLCNLRRADTDENKVAQSKFEERAKPAPRNRIIQRKSTENEEHIACCAECEVASEPVRQTINSGTAYRTAPNFSDTKYSTEKDARGCLAFLSLLLPSAPPLLLRLDINPHSLHNLTWSRNP